MDVSPLPLGSRSGGMPQSGSGDAGTGWEGITGGRSPGGVPGCSPPARCRHLALVLLPGPVIHAAHRHSYLSGLITLINMNYSVN